MSLSQTLISLSCFNLVSQVGQVSCTITAEVYSHDFVLSPKIKNCIALYRVNAEAMRNKL